MSFGRVQGGGFIDILTHTARDKWKKARNHKALPSNDMWFRGQFVICVTLAVRHRAMVVHHF